jgi:hypothetical protein
MSWKSLVSAGLLCVLASPAFADGPTLRVVNGPTLQAATGNWVWTVSIEPGFTETPVAAELGFVANSAVVGTPTAGALFDTPNPGDQIFTWETPGPDGEPVGIQVDGSEVFSAIGSDILPDSPAQSTYLTIITEGPTNSSLTGTLQVLGAYGAGDDEGRIAELTTGDTSVNYRNYTGTASRTLKNGDINLDGFADNTDVGIFAGQYQPGTGKNGGWTIGDFNGDGFVDNTDVGIFAGAYQPGVMGGSISNLTREGIEDPPAGAGSGGAVATPEPASAALVGLALLGGLGLFRRKR